MKKNATDAEGDDQPGAELVEVLDERGFLTVGEAPRQTLPSS